MKKFILAGLIVSAGIAVWQWIERQRKLLDNTCVKVMQASVKKLNLSEGEIVIKLGLKNKTDIETKIRGYVISADVGGVTVDTISSNEIIDIPKQSENEIPEFTVRFVPARIVAGLTASALSGKFTDFKLHIYGVVKLEVWKIGFDYPLDTYINVGRAILEPNGSC